MKYHVITPLARADLFEQLWGMLEAQRETAQCDIHWEVIIDTDSKIQLPIRPRENHPWIHFHRCPNEGVDFWKRCNNSINWFLDNTVLSLEERYLFLNDDDYYEPEFFRKVDACEGEIVICSMERGFQTPNTTDPYKRHPTSKLIAAPENMKVCHVGVEQIVLSGRMLSKYRLPIHVWGDGMMIERIVRENSERVVYLPDTNVWFNYLEQGRWK